MKGYIFAVLISCSLLVSAVGQELEPEEPDMVLPPMSLELEDLLTEDVDTVLPEQQFSPDLDADTELPGPPDIDAPVSVANLDLGLETDPTGGEKPREKTGSFYSNGKIGLGNTNRILGDLSIYKLGAEPHIQMRFLHERYDGYHFRERGSGYFHRQNLISGGISFRPETFVLDADAAFQENNDGLQGLGPYSSVLHRSIGGAAEYQHYFTDAISLRLGFNGLYTQETLSGENPLNDYEIALDPEIAEIFQINPVTLTIEGAYHFRFITANLGPLHGVTGTLRADVTLPKDWMFGGNVGVDWHTQKRIQVPFALYFRKGVEDVFDIVLRGGYETTLLRYGDIWLDSPYARLSGFYPEISRWFAFVDSEWNIVPFLALGGTVNFSLFERSVYHHEDLDSETGMLTMYSKGAYLLESEARLRWETLEWLSFQAFWRSNFFEVPSFVPEHTLGVSTILSSKNNVWRGEADIELPIPGRLEMPLLGVSLTFAPSAGVEFTLKGEDLLSPAMNAHRTEWGYFETPGLNVMFTASISL